MNIKLEELYILIINLARTYRRHPFSDTTLGRLNVKKTLWRHFNSSNPSIVTILSMQQQYQKYHQLARRAKWSLNFNASLLSIAL
jgi:hypothetical protein